MAQWRERSPFTIVSRDRFPEPASYVGWVCCWFSTLPREVFLRVLRFFPLLKNHHFQIPIRCGMHGHFWTTSCELLGAPWGNKLHKRTCNGKTIGSHLNNVSRNSRVRNVPCDVSFMNYQLIRCKRNKRPDQIWSAAHHKPKQDGVRKLGRGGDWTKLWKASRENI